MEFPTWSEELKIGIEEIDCQHRTIIADIKAIYDAISRHESRAATMQEMNKLLTDSEKHFTDEDILMVNRNYPAINEHVKQHEIFIARLNELRISYDPSDIERMHKDLEDLETWFVKHVMEYDKLYMEHMFV